MPTLKPIDPSTLSLKARAEKKYLIRDDAGLELGESEGPTKAEALVRLYKMDGLRITTDKAQEMILAGRVSFTILA